MHTVHNPATKAPESAGQCYFYPTGFQPGWMRPEPQRSSPGRPQRCGEGRAISVRELLI